MTPGDHLIRFIQSHASTILALFVGLLALSAWIVFEALRSHSTRRENFRLKRQLSALEYERVTLGPDFSDPIVLSRRWIRSGSAATTTDGGCLVYIDKVSNAIRSADITVRVDGDAILQKHPIHVGDRLEASGKYGTYILRLYATEEMQANLAVALRSHHADSDQLP